MEVNIVDPFVRKGYRFKGTGEVVVDGERFKEIMRFYRNRWVDTVREKREAETRAFVLMKLERASPLISPAYDDRAVTERVIRNTGWRILGH